MTVLVNSQTSTAAPLKFGNGKVISSHIYWACDYLSMLELKLIHVSKTAPGGQCLGNTIVQSMLTSYNGNAFRITSPVWGSTSPVNWRHKGPALYRFNVFLLAWIFYLNKQSNDRWFETPMMLMWRDCDAYHGGQWGHVHLKFECVHSYPCWSEQEDTSPWWL